MKHLPAPILALSLLLAAHAAQAGYDDPMPTFSLEEIAADQQNAPVISSAAAACLQNTWNTHVSFYKAHGYSKFYGNRRAEYKTVDGRKAALLKILPTLARRVRAGDQAAIKELNAREKELETTACVDLARKCLGQGFHAAGMDETWAKIDSWVVRPGPDGTPLVYGTDLQKALIALGWKSLYWNPDITHNQAWDEAEQAAYPPKEGMKWNPVWGGHALRWASVKNHHNYYGIPIQDIQTLVNFGTKPPADFQSIPFFVGTAHSGYHVFPGFAGQVFEAHSVRELKSIDNMQIGPFNPLDQAVNGVAGGNGSPKWTNSEHYRSGVIVVPPGFLADKPFVVPPSSKSTPPDGAPDFQVQQPDQQGDEDDQRERDDLCRSGYREYCPRPRDASPFHWPWRR
jgi:hypothetical protein